MHLIINGKRYEPREEAPAAVATVLWYDRKTRFWVVQKVDAEDNQIGDAEYRHRKSDALKVKALMDAEIPAELS